MTQPLSTTPSASASQPSRSPWLAIAGVSASVLFLSACNGADLTFEWDVDTIDGSGTVTTEVYDVSDFSEIEVCCNLNVRFEIEDGPEKVEISIDDNLHQHLAIEVDGEGLEIKPENNTNLDPTEEIVVTITGHEIDGLMVDTASDVTGTFPATDAFTVWADTAADVSIEVDTDRLVVSADTSADLVVTGRADVVDVNADTAADIDLVDLEVVDATVEADTAANVEITASGSVTGAIDTSADLHVWGNPDIDVDTDTDGRVHREG